MIVWILTVVFLQGVQQSDAVWSEWGSWSNCSVSCGFGTTSRIKTWEENGVRKNYSFSDIMECWTEKGCGVRGKWSVWSLWTECTAMCNGGFSRRSRTCNFKKPASAGKRCVGRKKDRRNCNTIPCPEIPQTFKMSMCNATSFICKSERFCVQKKRRCDYVLDCDDGSDEKNCPTLTAEKMFAETKRSGASCMDSLDIVFVILLQFHILNGSILYLNE